MNPQMIYKTGSKLEKHQVYVASLRGCLKSFWGDKFADYQTLESLQEYVLINTKRQRVECFRRNEQGL